MKKLIFAALVLLLPVVCPPVAEAVEVTFYWTAPTTGSPVAVYEFQISHDLENWTTVATPADTFTTVDLPVGTTYARVRGIDAQGRAGPWATNDTDPFIDLGPPGGCGIPIWRP